MSTKQNKRDDSPGNRRTVRLPTEESNQIKQAASGVMRSSAGATAAFGTNIGDAVVGEDALSLVTKISRLEKDLERRKASYAAREDSYKERVVSLEEELGSQVRGVTAQPKKTESKLHELKAIQSEILESVELVQDRTARIMQEQERDLLRSFRARLFDVQTELEKEKSKKDDGLAAWRERFTQLEAELDWATEVSNRLDKVNATLTEENNELKLKFASQEQDRNLFIELLVSLKKDNALWRSKNAEIIADNERLKTQVQLTLYLLMCYHSNSSLTCI
jgi:DNA repair exonuclease SbcCD ATPase subunit